MLEHAPSLVHQEGGPLTDALSTGKRNGETTSDSSEETAAHADDMVSNEIASFLPSVAELKDANDEIISAETCCQYEDVNLNLLWLQKALVRREDALSRVVTAVEAGIGCKGRYNGGVDLAEDSAAVLTLASLG